MVRTPLTEAQANIRRMRHRIWDLLVTVRRGCKKCRVGRVDLINPCADVRCPLWRYRRGPAILEDEWTDER